MVGNWKLKQDVFASSTILVKISHVMWIFLPWVFKYIAKKWKLSNQITNI